MAQAMVNFRMDSDEKNSFEEVCEQLGLSITSAFKMFAKKVIREKRIPFEVSLESSDPFYSESNLEHLRRGIKALNEGKGVEHEIIEVK
ncbi:type II toxin-antitoxin system RelB/DinJ family antitoxin [uncultured Treponema sp.]|uniref:type II toxin-antitoxin system RelB/DinJ family antitoxin n=1 Tax=uncultured Treponema sp. TaxID=162155 RepID=UPI0025D50C35|nr:type II toxin-antitoxin system RelB/DinJ family antitoxin [uncultured Treponema sp.]